MLEPCPYWSPFDWGMNTTMPWGEKVMSSIWMATSSERRKAPAKPKKSSALSLRDARSLLVKRSASREMVSMRIGALPCWKVPFSLRMACMA